MCHVPWYTHCTMAFFTFSMSFSSSVNSKCDVTSPVRKAYGGLPGTNFHKTLHAQFHPNSTTHFERTERNSVTPASNRRCGVLRRLSTHSQTLNTYYQHTHKHSIHIINTLTNTQYILSTHSQTLNTYQHTHKHSIHIINTLTNTQYILSTHKHSIHIINKLTNTQYILSTHKHSIHIINTQTLNTYYQHTHKHSIHIINTQTLNTYCTQCQPF
jgi:hypothetical protein